jgi:hypothetical protein
MANTYIWAIPFLTVKPVAHDHADVVITANWVLTADDGNGHVCSSSGATDIPYVSGEFIPYPDLTESEVLGWVQAQLGTDQIAALEAALDANILLQQNPPPVVLTPPWLQN